MRPLLILALLCIGCGKKEPERVIIEIKSDNPILEAMGEDALEQAKAAKWIEQANEEWFRLFKEQDEADFKGLTGEWSTAYADICVEYNRRKVSDGPGKAAEWFVGQVKGKRITDFSPR